MVQKLSSTHTPILNGLSMPITAALPLRCSTLALRARLKAFAQIAPQILLLILLITCANPQQLLQLVTIGRAQPLNFHHTLLTVMSPCSAPSMRTPLPLTGAIRVWLPPFRMLETHAKHRTLPLLPTWPPLLGPSRPVLLTSSPPSRWSSTVRPKQVMVALLVPYRLLSALSPPWAPTKILCGPTLE